MRHAKSTKGTLHAESVRQPERTKETPELRETHSDTARTCSYKQSDGNTLEVSQLSQLLETFSLPAEEQRLVGLTAIHNGRDVKRSLAWIRDKVPRDWKGWFREILEDFGNAENIFVTITSKTYILMIFTHSHIRKRICFTIYCDCGLNCIRGKPFSTENY